MLSMLKKIKMAAVILLAVLGVFFASLEIIDWIFGKPANVVSISFDRDAYSDVGIDVNETKARVAEFERTLVEFAVERDIELDLNEANLIMMSHKPNVAVLVSGAYHDDDSGAYPVVHLIPLQ